MKSLIAHQMNGRLKKCAAVFITQIDLNWILENHNKNAMNCLRNALVFFVLNASESSNQCSKHNLIACSAVYLIQGIWNKKERLWYHVRMNLVENFAQSKCRRLILIWVKYKKQNLGDKCARPLLKFNTSINQNVSKSNRNETKTIHANLIIMLKVQRNRIWLQLEMTKIVVFFSVASRHIETVRFARKWRASWKRWITVIETAMIAALLFFHDKVNSTNCEYF